jgi:hypothetical protein
MDDGATYRCQFCGEITPVDLWKKDGEECPNCHRQYDWFLAQESGAMTPPAPDAGQDEAEP